LLNGERKRDMSQGVLLVVDDEEGVRQSLQLVFNRTYRVFEATSAEEAIENVTAAAHTLDLDGHKGASATAPTAQYRSAIAVTMNLAAAALTTEQTLPAWVHQRLTVALGRSYV